MLSILLKVYILNTIILCVTLNILYKQDVSLMLLDVKKPQDRTKHYYGVEYVNSSNMSIAYTRALHDMVSGM